MNRTPTVTDKENTMLIPDGLPILSRGKHESPVAGACFMEYASFLAGERWSDAPACTMPLLATAARLVNDLVDDVTRQSLAVHIPRVIGTATDDLVLQVRLAAWCARYVLPMVREQHQAVCLAAIEAAEGWCAGKQECNVKAATAAANAANAANATAAAYAAYAAAYAADAAAYAAAYAADVTYAAAYAAASAAASTAAYAAASAASTAAYAAFLLALLDEHDRLTGRSAQHLTPEQAARLCVVTLGRRP